MEIQVTVHTITTCGGNPSLSLIGGFLQLDLPDFGGTVKELEVHVYFDSKPTEEAFCTPFDSFIKSLPTVDFLRKKGRIEIHYLSKLGTADIVAGYGPPQLELFARGARELVGEISAIRAKLKKSDAFDAVAFLQKMNARLDRLPKSPPEFADLQAAIGLARTQRDAALSDWDKLAVDWEDFHPRAREILDDVFYWDCTDDFAPNGNDTGADVLELYQEWRTENQQRPAMAFLDQLMSEWDVSVPANGDEFSVTTFEESIVGLAFAQLKVDGACEAEIRAQALDTLAQQRQRTQELHRDWDLFEERMRALQLLESKLQAVSPPAAGRK